MATLSQKIGFIGAGNMGEAFIGALLKSNICATENVFISDVNPNRLSHLKAQYGVETTLDNQDLFLKADIVVLAVKPQQIVEVLTHIARDPDYRVSSRKLVISIAAGTTIAKIEDLLYSGLDDNSKKKLPIVRVMPNTPALVLSGMAGMSPNRNCTPEDIQTARIMLLAMGKVIELPEEHLDAVTAMSGSGPAYVFYVIEAMTKAGLDLGLSSRHAFELTLETIKGAVKLLEAGGETPEALRRKVTSPGGTTEAALKVFDKLGLKNNIAEGISAAFERSKELSGS